VHLYDAHLIINVTQPLNEEFCQVDCRERKTGLKAGWQINRATSLNIYSCWLEIILLIFCCTILKKNSPVQLLILKMFQLIKVIYKIKKM